MRRHPAGGPIRPPSGWHQDGSHAGRFHGLACPSIPRIAPNRPACEARSAVTQADRGLYYTLVYHTFTGSGPKRPACDARFAVAQRQSSSEECRLLGQSPSAQCDCVVSGGSVSCPHLEFPQQKLTESPKFMPLPWASAPRTRMVSASCFDILLLTRAGCSSVTSATVTL